MMHRQHLRALELTESKAGKENYFFEQSRGFYGKIIIVKVLLQASFFNCCKNNSFESDLPIVTHSGRLSEYSESGFSKLILCSCVLLRTACQLLNLWLLGLYRGSA